MNTKWKRVVTLHDSCDEQCDIWFKHNLLYCSPLSVTRIWSPGLIASAVNSRWPVIAQKYTEKVANQAITQLNSENKLSQTPEIKQQVLWPVLVPVPLIWKGQENLADPRDCKQKKCFRLFIFFFPLCFFPVFPLVIWRLTNGRCMTKIWSLTWLVPNTIWKPARF